MRKLSRLRRLFAVAFVLVLAGCGGGGGLAVAPTPTPRDSGLGTIALSIAVPPPGSAARTRMPQYVSSSSYQAAVIVTPQGGTALAPQILVCQIPAGGV